MIELHRLDNTKTLINSDLIESVEESPDTVVTLTNGNKYIVKEDIKEILKKIVDFKRNIQVKITAGKDNLKNEMKNAD